MNATEEARIDTAVKVLLHDIKSEKRFILSRSRPAILYYIFVYFCVLIYLYIFVFLPKLTERFIHGCVNFASSFCWFVFFKFILLFDWGVFDYHREHQRRTRRKKLGLNSCACTTYSYSSTGSDYSRSFSNSRRVQQQPRW